MTNEIKPGSWHDSDENDDHFRKFEERQAQLKREGYPTEFIGALQNVYDSFQTNFGVPARVFYPSCGMDITPVKAFPRSEVVLMDKDELAVRSLRKNDVEAICADATQYKPDKPFDLLILMNPAIETGRVAHLVRPNGHIIANDWHQNTSQMLAEPSAYEFMGTFNHEKTPAQLLSVESSRGLLARTDPFFNLYSLFRKI